MNARTQRRRKTNDDGYKESKHTNLSSQPSTKTIIRRAVRLRVLRNRFVASLNALHHRLIKSCYSRRAE
eukprot:scaffold203267_cov60-Cyclotella_meneghiniana.AAC.1